MRCITKHQCLFPHPVPCAERVVLTKKKKEMSTNNSRGDWRENFILDETSCSFYVLFFVVEEVLLKAFDRLLL